MDSTVLAAIISGIALIVAAVIGLIWRDKANRAKPSNRSQEAGRDIQDQPKTINANSASNSPIIQADKIDNFYLDNSKKEPGAQSDLIGQESDKSILKQIKAMLPYERSIDAAYQHVTDSAFRITRFDDFYNFISACKNPTFRFQDAELESTRKNLLEAVQHFTNLIASETRESNGEVYRVPQEWEYTQPARARNAYQQLQQSGDKIHEHYVQLMLLGQNKLGLA